MLTHGGMDLPTFSVAFRALRGSPLSTGTGRRKKIPCASECECTASRRQNVACGRAGNWSTDLCNNNFFSNAILGCKGNQVKTRKRSKQDNYERKQPILLAIAPRRLATLVSRAFSHVRLDILHACCHRMKSSIFFFCSAATSCFARMFHTFLFLFIDGIYPSCCQAVGIVGS